jgi:hypothetical protein
MFINLNVDLTVDVIIYFSIFVYFHVSYPQFHGNKHVDNYYVPRHHLQAIVYCNFHS